jgi:hypothetical protein
VRATRIREHATIMDEIRRTPGDASARASIDALTAAFFRAFTPDPDGRVDLSRLTHLFIERALIIKNLGARPEVCSLRQFIEPRQALFDRGELRDFREEEVSARTDIFGAIAQRWVLYRKSGVLAGTRFDTRGMKSLQFIATANGWRISALIWDDEPEARTS